MPTLPNPERVPAHLVGVPNDARPYGTAGNLPADAVTTTYSVHGREGAVRYVSDVPYEQPYQDRPTCSGTRRDGQPCKAKAEPAKEYCRAHDPEG